MLIIFVLVLIFLLNIVSHVGGILLLSENIHYGILLILSLYGAYSYYKLLGNYKDLIKSGLFIIIVGLFLGFFVNELPSYALGFLSFVIGMIFSSLIYLKLFKQSIFNSYKESIKFILSFQVVIILLTNLFIISPLSNNIIPFKIDKVYEVCINDTCFEMYDMMNPSFFGDNYIQVYSYNRGYPFLIFKKNIIGYRLPDDIGEKFIINLVDNNYILEFMYKGKLKSITIE